MALGDSQGSEPVPDNRKQPCAGRDVGRDPAVAKNFRGVEQCIFGVNRGELVLKNVTRAPEEMNRTTPGSLNRFGLPAAILLPGPPKRRRVRLTSKASLAFLDSRRDTPLPRNVAHQFRGGMELGGQPAPSCGIGLGQPPDDKL